MRVKVLARFARSPLLRARAICAVRRIAAAHTSTLAESPTKHTQTQESARRLGDGSSGDGGGARGAPADAADAAGASSAAPTPSGVTAATEPPAEAARPLPLPYTVDSDGKRRPLAGAYSVFIRGARRPCLDA